MAKRDDSYLLDGGDEVGMTNEQYKGMLIDQLRIMKDIREMAIKAGNSEIQKKAENAIDDINVKLKF